jgi:hypothetical protein
MALDVLGFLLGAAFGTWLLFPVVQGIHTGRIQHQRISHKYPRSGATSFRNQPIRFIFIASVFILFSGIVFFFTILKGLAIWHRLAA